MSPRPSAPSSLCWLFCGSSVSCRPPPQTMERKRRRAAKARWVKLGLILVCTASEWAAYCQNPPVGQILRACMEMPARPFTRSARERASSTTSWNFVRAHLSPFVGTQPPFCTFQPLPDSWDRMVRLFVTSYDKQLTECNPGSAFLPHLSSNSDPSHLEKPKPANWTEAWSFVHFRNHVPHS